MLIRVWVINLPKTRKKKIDHLTTNDLCFMKVKPKHQHNFNIILEIFLFGWRSHQNQRSSSVKFDQKKYDDNKIIEYFQTKQYRKIEKPQNCTHFKHSFFCWFSCLNYFSFTWNQINLKLVSINCEWEKKTAATATQNQHSVHSQCDRTRLGWYHFSLCNLCNYIISKIWPWTKFIVEMKSAMYVCVIGAA